MSAHTPDVPGSLAGDDALNPMLPDRATAAESEAHALGRTLARRLEGVGTLLISLLDVGVAAAAWQVAHTVRIGLAPQLGPLIPFTSGSQAPPWLPEGVFLGLYALALYGNGCLSSERPLWVLRRQLLAGAGALFVFLVLSYLFKWLTVSRAFLAVMGVALPLGIVFEWFFIRAVRKIGQRWGLGINRVLVAGDTLSASWVLHDLERNASWGIRAIGLVSDDATLLDSARRNAFNVRVVPGVSQVASWAVRLKADQVVLCLPDVDYAELADTIQELWKQGVRVYVLRPELSVHLRSAEEPQSLFRGTELVDYGACVAGRRARRRSAPSTCWSVPS